MSRRDMDACAWPISHAHAGRVGNGQVFDAVTGMKTERSPAAAANASVSVAKRASGSPARIVTMAFVSVTSPDTRNLSITRWMVGPISSWSNGYTLICAVSTSLLPLCARTTRLSSLDIHPNADTSHWRASARDSRRAPVERHSTASRCSMRQRRGLDVATPKRGSARPNGRLAAAAAPRVEQALAVVGAKKSPHHATRSASRSALRIWHNLEYGDEPQSIRA